MTTEQMRAEIAKTYSSKTWHDKVRKMSDGQVIAIYKRFLADGKIK